MSEEFCTVCNNTLVYVNARGGVSDIPCNLCDPKGWEMYLAKNRRK